MQFPGQDPSHLRGHWMSADDRYMVTPDEFTGTATIYDMTEDKIVGKVKTGHSPIAVGMTPDGYLNNLNFNLYRKVQEIQ